MTQDFEPRDIEPASALRRRLNLPFSNLSLLTRALTHRSYVNENPNSQDDNERLEFLGDAVLELIAPPFGTKFVIATTATPAELRTLPSASTARSGSDWLDG